MNDDRVKPFPGERDGSATGTHPDAHTSVEPSILVKVSNDANRDEITGAVARALASSDVPFLRGRAEQVSTPELQAAASPATALHKQEAQANENTLAILVQTEGTGGGG